jgi:methyltransferase (TIGR00027 family)
VRAVHSLLDDPVVFDDPLALRILGPEREARLRADPFVLNDRMSRGLRAVLVARARVAEDELRERIAAGVRQAVVLGAGLDTLSLRAPLFHPELRVFEVDHPATQEAKRRKLAETQLALPPQSTLVPVDFDHDDVGERLTQAGLRGDAPVFFNWLGVAMYLAPPVVHATLAWVARNAPGSAIVFDYRVPLHTLANPVERVISTFVEQGIAQRGEPFRSAFEPEALARTVQALGYREVIDLGPAELNARLFARRRDGLSIGGTSRVMVARV